MPVEEMELEIYQIHKKIAKKNNKSNRMSINLFGHKYYIKPKEEKIYKILGFVGVGITSFGLFYTLGLICEAVMKIIYK